jgi:hypothetical protein
VEELSRSMYIHKKAEGSEKWSFVVIFVDDGRIRGTPDAFKECIEAIGKSFKVNIMDEMENYVGCHILDAFKKNCVWIH